MRREIYVSRIGLSHIRSDGGGMIWEDLLTTSAPAFVNMTGNWFSTPVSLATQTKACLLDMWKYIDAQNADILENTKGKAKNKKS